MPTKMKIFTRAVCVSFAVVLGCAGAVAQTISSVQPTSGRTAQVSADWSPFITPADLSANLFGGDVQVIDIRSKKYLKHGVVPGAVWMPFADWRGPKSRPGNPPKTEKLAEMLGQAGLRLDRPIVVHNHSNKTIQNGRAAIVYWILKSAGAQQLAVLNGGFKGWKAEGLPTAETHAQKKPTKLDVAYSYEWWADPMDILAISSSQQEGAILDSRLDAQVRKSVESGKPMMSMPFAQYIPASLFANELASGNLTEPAKQAFRADLVNRGVELDTGLLISVCQTGELSALSWFYASEIVGIKNVHYYPDALQGWRSDGGIMFGMNGPDT